MLYFSTFIRLRQYKAPLHTPKIKSNSITQISEKSLINSMADIIATVYEDFADFLVSDDEWAEELQFQEVLAASLLMQESPESSKCFCDICMETKDTNEMFKLENCSDHSFCSDCIAQYVQSKIQDRIFPVTCPASKYRATIEPVSCKSIIPEDVFEKWEGGLTESFLSGCKTINCPCSAQLTYDQDQDIIECICPACKRLLCAACGVPWHTGLDCDEFQKDAKNREDDLKVEELANNSKWMKCPHCKHIVEKADGCIHMTCRCGSEFCYVCGKTWSANHWSCQTSE